MKIFIWKNVLYDYSAGMAFAYAKDLETALKEFPPSVAENIGAPTYVIDTENDTETKIAYVYGGG